MVGLDDFVSCTRVVATDDGGYTAENLELGYYRIFGGQLLAQTIAVAALDTGKTVKSLHVVFPREGLSAEPVRFVVDRLHDGRAYATRQITGVQSSGKPILAAQVSCHVPEEGPFEQQQPAPTVPGPDEATPVDDSMVPLETRFVDGVDVTDRAVRPPRLDIWVRAAERLGDDAELHQGLLTYYSDLTLIGTSLLPIDGYSQADSPERLHTAVVTHSVWFHRPFRIDDWLLASQHSPVLAGARGFGIGHVYDRAGDLVASYAQESMVRSGGR